MLFICESCGFEMDYDEVETEIIECEECGNILTPYQE